MLIKVKEKYEKKKGLMSMKNKEKYINLKFDDCTIMYSDVFNKDCDCKCKGCVFWNIERFVNFMNEECTEPIVLTQFEYDILSCCDESKRKKRFNYYTMCMQLKNKGYYKGVYDVKMTVEEILNNCEIVK